MARRKIDYLCGSDQQVHPKFNSDEADTVISSNQGTLFCLSSITLRMTSGYFRSLLPKDTQSETARSSDITPASTSFESKVHYIPFPDAPLERVLLMMSGLSTPPWSSFAELDGAVDVIEYLDAPGPLSIIRASCLAPLFLSEPVRVYALGARFGWDEVTQHAAVYTLPINLLYSSQSPLPASSPSDGKSGGSNGSGDGDADLEDQLSRIPGPALFRLLKFHRRRRDTFRTLLWSPTMFTVGNADNALCRGCDKEVDNSSWRELRSRLLWEIDQDASGKSILSLEMEEWEESMRCWNAKCRTAGCETPLYHRLVTMKEIRDCVEQLPELV